MSLKGEGAGAARAASGLGPALPAETLRQLFDAAPALIAAFEGPRHVYVYSNPANDQALGGRARTGLSLVEALPELVGQPLLARFDRVFATGEADEAEEQEVDLAGPDGTMRRAWFRHTLQPWLDAEGAVAGVLSFAYDVTEHVLERGAAQESEERLAQALKATRAVGAFEWDVGHDLVTVDARFAEVYGVPAEAARSGLPLVAFTDRIHPEDRERVGAAIAASLAACGPYEEEYRVTGADGVVRWVLATGRCRAGADGAPSRFSGVVVDITDRRDAEEALRASESRLRVVFDSIDQGYCIAEMILDEDGAPVDYRFIEVNPLFEAMTGLRDVVGGTAYELIPGLERKWLDIYARVALGGEATRFEEGSEAMGRWFDVFATPIPPRGRFAIVFRDVTSQRAAARALAESEARFRSMTEAMPQMVWATRPDGHHDFFNARWYEFTGLPEGSTDGEDWAGAFHPDDIGEARRLWAASLASGAPYEVEYRLRHRSGAWRWVLGRAAPVRGEGGAIVRWLGTCTDIQALKEAEAQRGLMLAELNHRVKNTLAMVHAIVNQSLRQAEDLAGARDAVQARIAALAQAHDGLLKDDWSETSVAEAVEGALRPHRTGEGRFDVRGPELRLGARQALALTMAIHELATNAAKHGAASASGGAVSITWRAEAEEGGEEPTFRLSWAESGGPPVSAPARQGFGSQMLTRALPAYFGGTARLDYAPGGVVYEIAAPIGGLTR